MQLKWNWNWNKNLTESEIWSGKANFLDNVKFNYKLTSGFLAVAIITGIIGMIGIINVKSIQKSADTMYQNMTVPISQMSSISTLFQRIRVDIRDMVLAEDIDEIEKCTSSISQKREQITQLGEAFGKTISPDEKEMKAVYDDFINAQRSFYDEIERTLSLAKINMDSAAVASLQETGAIGIATKTEENAITKLVDMKVADAKAKAQKNASLAGSTLASMIFLVIAGITLAVGIGLYLSSAIIKPLKMLLLQAERVASGDLADSPPINRKDELGDLARAFDSVADNLNEVMTEINVSAQQVATGASQISTSGQMLSQGSTEQAGAIEQITSSMTQVAAQTKENAANANQANELAVLAKQNAIAGNNQMQQMLTAMSEINDSSTNISKIIKVIDDIAFQTNILALNAAVEAARAGQQGRGFAVVAEEVRNLAARSADAAKETTVMIEGSIKKVGAGTKIANQTASALGNIVNDITKAADIVGGIAIASSEQATAIAQVNLAIEQVSQVVQTNTATAEESAAASEELSGQAQILKQAVSKFKLREETQNIEEGTYRLTPEMAKMLNEMIKNKNNAALPEMQELETVPAGSVSKPQISLTDTDFEKY